MKFFGNFKERHIPREGRKTLRHKDTFIRKLLRTTDIEMEEIVTKILTYSVKKEQKRN
jgi:hypothetical protein